MKEFLLTLKIITYQLTSPLHSYSRIEHSGKNIYDWYIPIFLTLIFAIFIYLNNSIDSEKVKVILDKLLTFLAILPGFYIAAIAAISTFQNSLLDRKLDGESAKVKFLVSGDMIETNLTRRQLLSLVFSYLSALSLFLFLFAIIISQLITCELNIWILSTVFSIFFIQLIIITLFGLYYLGERMHHNS